MVSAINAVKKNIPKGSGPLGESNENMKTNNATSSRVDESKKKIPLKNFFIIKS